MDDVREQAGEAGMGALFDALKRDSGARDRLEDIADRRIERES